MFKIKNHGFKVSWLILLQIIRYNVERLVLSTLTSGCAKNQMDWLKFWISIGFLWFRFLKFQIFFFCFWFDGDAGFFYTETNWTELIYIM